MNEDTVPQDAVPKVHRRTFEIDDLDPAIEQPFQLAGELGMESLRRSLHGLAPNQRQVQIAVVSKRGAGHAAEEVHGGIVAGALPEESPELFHQGVALRGPPGVERRLGCRLHSPSIAPIRPWREATRGAQPSAAMTSACSGKRPAADLENTTRPCATTSNCPTLPETSVTV